MKELARKAASLLAPGGLKRRLTTISALAVAVAIALASIVVFVIVRSELRGQVDESLISAAAAGHSVTDEAGRRLFVLPRAALGGPRGYAQLIAINGARSTFPSGSGPELPVSHRVLDVASGKSGSFFSDEMVQGTHVRMYTSRVAAGVALQVVRPLTEVDAILGRLALVLLLIVLGGAALAALLGRVVAQATLAPVRRLTVATEHVTSTSDLARRIETGGSDELSRLASSFNAMLEALENSLRSQRQLVADASHELRTPLTSMRTNIEMLSRYSDMPPGEKAHLVAEITTQIEEMTALVSDLVELAREDEPLHIPQEVRLDRLVERSVERVRRYHPVTDFRLETQSTVIKGLPERLDRAVGNLLDNAAKWSPRGSPVEVTVTDAAVTVSDHGPGIRAEDLPHIFDRFYRAPDARAMPGSGLGLAIVRQVVEVHGGKVTVDSTPGRGTSVRIELGSKETSPRQERFRRKARGPASAPARR